MPAVQMPPESDLLRVDRLKPTFDHVETQNYNQRTEEVREDWLRRLEQSTFLTIKYGLIDAEGALERISNMEKNWDSYGSEPPSANAIRESKQILTELAKALILPSTVVPSAGGGVSIYFMNDDRTAYVETYNGGDQALVMYDQIGNTEVLEIGSEILLPDVSSRIRAYLG